MYEISVQTARFKSKIYQYVCFSIFFELSLMALNRMFYSSSLLMIAPCLQSSSGSTRCVQKYVMNAKTISPINIALQGSR